MIISNRMLKVNCKLQPDVTPKLIQALTSFIANSPVAPLLLKLHPLIRLSKLRSYIELKMLIYTGEPIQR